MATPVDNAVALTGNPHIDGLVQGSAWSFGSGARVVTVALSLNDTPNGGVWSYPLNNAIVQALGEWSKVANMAFAVTGQSALYNQTTADIAITLVGNELEQVEPGVLALGVFPSPSFTDTFIASIGHDRSSYPNAEGDIALDNYNSAFNSSYPGGFGFLVLLHEIGHALGLKHSFDDGGNARPTFAGLGIGSFDNTKYTVMSYNHYGGVSSSSNPSTPMLFDIEAIQQIYGANTTYNTGDDTYSLQYDGSTRTIWDAGGIDTLNAAFQGTSASIDLRSGNYSTLGNATVAIAYNVTIENAIGGSSADSLIGNDADNRLDGGGGTDVMIGGLGNDTYVIDQIGDVASEQANEGIDLVEASITYSLGANLEALALTGGAAINGTGNEADNTITGNSGANAIGGAAGNDLLNGGAGNDSIDGGAGDDQLDGGAGLDTMQGGIGDDTYIVAQYDPAVAPTALVLQGAPGAYILDNSTLGFTPESGSFTVTLSDRTLDGVVDTLVLAYQDNAGASVHWFYLNLSTRQLGQNLVPGIYENAEREAFATAGHPGLDVFGDGRGANQVFGQFTIVVCDIDYSGASPSLTNFSATFEHHSESPSAPAVIGTFNYHYAGGAFVPELVQEAPGEGNDTVRSSIDYVLPANVENLLLTGAGAINGTGNALDNTITGNALGNRLDGNLGNDTITGALGNDTIDGGPGSDTAVYAAAKASYTVTRVGANYTVTGGTDGGDTLTGIEWLQFSDSLMKLGGTLNADTNADGKSDILWQHSGTGALYGYQMNGTAIDTQGYVATSAAAGWTVKETRADHNGDGRADILWFEQAGNSLYLYQMNGNAIQSQGFIVQGVPAGWNIMETRADYNGDGKADILWKSNDNATYIYLMDGSTITGQGYERSGIGADWIIAEARGDYNGDGKSDILWQNTVSGALYLDQINGTAIQSEGFVTTSGAASWQVIDATSDFGGDGKSDILWFNQTANSLYLYQMNGGVIQSQGFIVQGVPAGWDIMETRGDYNGDGKADILWKSNDNATYIYLMDGSTIAGQGYERAGIGTDWIIADAKGDYNGDGKSDILWQNTASGALYLDQISGTGIQSEGFVTSSGAVGWGIIDQPGAVINGDASANVLRGTPDADVLNGMGGNDTFNGGVGNDRFVFNTALNAANNIDTISDFASSADKIVLDHLIFTALGVGSLAAGSLVSGAGAAALDPNDTLLYDTTIGGLSYDADGNGIGAAIQFATLSANPTLSAADFSIV